jgi:predicted transcriptional regulator
MRPVPNPLDPGETLAAAAAQLSQVDDGVLPVADADGTYLGVVTAHSVSDALAQGEPDLSPTNLLVELPTRVTCADFVITGVQALDASGLGAVPVFAEHGPEVVGWFDYRTALRVLEPRIDVSEPPNSPAASLLPAIGGSSR